MSTNQNLEEIAARIEVSPLVIGPKQAKRLLENAGRNRKISGEKVSRLALTMREGLWLPGMSMIVTDTNGQLIDGQHRMSAIVQSQTEQVFICRFDAPPEAIRSIDTGRSRSAACVLQIEGEKNASALATLASQYLKMQRDGLGGLVNRSGGDDPATIAAFVADNQWLNEHIPVGASVASLGIRSHMGLLSAIMRVGDDTPHEDVLEFARKLKSGEMLHSGSPIYQLRKRLLAAMMGRKGKGMNRDRLNTAEKFGLLFKAWNLWVSGKTVAQLSYKPNAEGMVHPISPDDSAGSAGSVWTAERVRSLRASLGMSRVALAEILNVSTTLVTKWEQDESGVHAKAAKEMEELEAMSDE